MYVVLRYPGKVITGRGGGAALRDPFWWADMGYIPDYLSRHAPIESIDGLEFV